MQWFKHLLLRVFMMGFVFFILFFMLSGDGSSDAMGNGMQAGFALLISFSITFIGSLIFLAIEFNRLSNKKEKAKANINITLMILIFCSPIIVLNT